MRAHRKVERFPARPRIPRRFVGGGGHVLDMPRGALRSAMVGHYVFDGIAGYYQGARAHLGYFALAK
eukprot:7628527-Pyramimonas_sp.AAC.1